MQDPGVELPTGQSTGLSLTASELLSDGLIAGGQSLLGLWCCAPLSGMPVLRWTPHGELLLLEYSLPRLGCRVGLGMQEPSSFVAEYTAPATLITSSCKVAKNTTDGWTRTLYSAGDPVTYASWDAFMAATADGTATPVFSPSVRVMPFECHHRVPTRPHEGAPL